MNVTKTCSKCKVEKLLSEFRKQAATKDGLRYDCKQCQDLRQKAHYAHNKDRYVANAKKWQSTHPDLVKKIKKDYIVKARLKFSPSEPPPPHEETPSEST